MDAHQNPCAMVVGDTQQVNSEEQDRVDRHLATQVELQANTDADSLDSKLVVSADFYHLKYEPKQLALNSNDLSLS